MICQPCASAGRRAGSPYRFIVALLCAWVATALSACHDHSNVVTLRAVEVSPVTATLAAGTSVQLYATALYSDNSHSDITAEASWSSSSSSATVGTSTGKVVGAAVGSATITASYQGLSNTATVTVTAATLVSIAVTPAAPSVAAGTSEAFKATGTFTDNSTQDLTADVSWASSDTSIASVDTAGVGAGVSPGSATITASCAVASVCGSVMGSATLKVTAAALASIAITPRAPSIALGTSKQLTATGTYTDKSTHDLTSQVTWTSGTPSVATLSAAGLASTHSTGTTSVTAALNGVTSASVILTVTAADLVSIAVTPRNPPSIGVGMTEQFTATGTYTDQSTQNITSTVTWSSDTPAAATISNAVGSSGLATGAAAGRTNISAALGSITSASVSLGVTVLTTTLSASPSSLALSVNNTAGSPFLTGIPRYIVITNTGTLAAALNVTPSAASLPAGTSLSTTCASLAPAASCTVTITPGATASSAIGDQSPVPISLNVSGDNTNTVSVPVVVLTYGSVYQGGYVYSVDDTTPASGSIGGSVLGLADLSTSLAWAPDSTAIYGIDETSTAATPSPAGGQLTGMAACNGAQDGDCDSANIVDYYNNFAGGAPIPLTTYGAGACAAQTASGFSDWYLPAVCEMGYDAGGSGSGCGSSGSPAIQNVQSNLVDSGVSTGLLGWYLTATEYSASPAVLEWAFYTFSAGTSTQGVVQKSFGFGARCVRHLTH